MNSDVPIDYSRLLECLLSTCCVLVDTPGRNTKPLDWSLPRRRRTPQPGLHHNVIKASSAHQPCAIARAPSEVSRSLFFRDTHNTTRERDPSDSQCYRSQRCDVYRRRRTYERWCCGLNDQPLRPTMTFYLRFSALEGQDRAYKNNVNISQSHQHIFQNRD